MTLISALVCLLALQAGCSVEDLATEQRAQRGLVIVLPGIEGRSVWNVNIARGLDEGGFKGAIEIFDWGTAVPGGAIINLTDLERNRLVAQQLKRRIMRYRRQQPGRPVHLVGHSGGAGVALLTIEDLPRDAPLTSAILLAAAVSPTHDLRCALRRTEYGIFNYYSPYDKGFLVLGTGLFGTIDRQHGAAAGAVGFKKPMGMDEEDAAVYDKLHQIKWKSEMRRQGHYGGHMGWASREFVRDVLAPLINSLKPIERSGPGFRSEKRDREQETDEGRREKRPVGRPERKPAGKPDKRELLAPDAASGEGALVRRALSGAFGSE
ncbi:MAG: hypothetical protein ABII12_04615 [Planctomycetota bacterium]